MGRYSDLKRKLLGKNADRRSSKRKKQNDIQHTVHKSEDIEESDAHFAIGNPNTESENIEEINTKFVADKDSSHCEDRDTKIAKDRDAKFTAEEPASNQTEDRDTTSAAEELDSHQSEDAEDRHIKFAAVEQASYKSEDAEERLTKFAAEKPASNHSEDIADLETDYKINLEKPLFKCKVCDEEFFRKDAYSNHLKYHEEDPEYHCPTCMKSFNDEDLFHEHQETHKPHKKIEREMAMSQLMLCKWEPIVDKNLQDEGTGISTSNSERKETFEPDADQAGSEDDDFTIMNDSPPGSDNNTNTELDLSSTRPYRDKKKKKRFEVTFPALNRKSSINIITESPHKCDECGVCLSSKYYLQRHQLIHQDEKPHVCDVCQKQYRWRKGFLNHLYKHSENPQKCSICHSWFALEQNMKEHAKTCQKVKKQNHSKDKATKKKSKNNYTCEVCGKNYSNPARLREHQLIHFEKKFICSYCGKAFAQPNGLRKHERYHNDYKPYTCDVCSKSYYTATSLKRHKVIHTEDTPFKCDICGKCFAFQHMLRDHQDVMHKKNKLFQCTTCLQGFSYKCSLKKHMETHFHE